MVDVTQAFYDRIVTSTVVMGIIGNRLYNDAPPETMTPPACIFWKITDRVFASLGGAIGMDQATFQVDAYGRTRTEADNLAWELWTYLDGFIGFQGNVLIKDISRGEGGVIHSFDPVSGGTDQRRFIASQDFVLTYDSKNLYATI